MSDKEFGLKNREWELQRLEDQLNAQKKEMALAKFDQECEVPSVSNTQLATIAEKYVIYVIILCLQTSILLLRDFPLTLVIFGTHGCCFVHIIATYQLHPFLHW